MKEKAKPIKKLRYGALSVSIWRDTFKDPKGNSFQVENIVLDRSYKDKHGDWQHTNSLRKDDLLKAAFALQKAYESLAETGTETETEQAEDSGEVETERVR